MSHRASWDEAWKRYAARVLHKIGQGADAPLAHAGVFRLNQALLKTGFPNFFGSVKYFLSEL